MKTRRQLSRAFGLMLGSAAITLTLTAQPVFFYDPAEKFEGPLKATEIAYWPTNGVFTDIWHLSATQDRLYASTQSGLLVLNRETLQTQGFLRGGTGPLTQGTGVGNLVFHGNTFYDLSDPSHPVQISSIPVEQGNFSVYRNGYLYGLEPRSNEADPAPRQLLIMDATDPLNPVPVANVPEILGDDIDVRSPNEHLILYRYGDPGTVSIIDIRDPRNPKATPDFPSSALTAQKNSILYIGHDQETSIYDIANISEPVQIGSLGVFPGRMQVSGDTLYHVDQGGATLRVYNISDPAKPVLARTVTSIFIPWGYFVVYGNRLYTTREVWNLDNPLSPVRLRAYNPFFGQPGVMGSWPGGGLTGTHAYIGLGSTGGYHIVDYSNPHRPIRVGNFNPGTVRRIIGDKAYVFGSAQNPAGNLVSVYDLSNPRTPQRLAGASVSSFPLDVITEDNRLYVAVSKGMFASGATIRVYDTSDKAILKLLGSYDILGQPDSLAVYKNVLYIHMRNSDTTGDGVFEITDLSNPASPEFLNTIESPEYVQAMKVDGNRLYVTANDLHVYDITEPGSPMELPRPNHGYPLLKQGSRLYTSEPSGIGIYDISDPAQPQFLDSIVPNGNPADISVNGNVIAVTTFGSPLQLFQLDPLTSASDDFADGNDEGWLRWSPFSAFGAPATFTLENGAVKITSPKSPAPQVLYTYAGSARADLNFTDVEAQVDVSGWLAGEGDSSSIALQVRGQAHPGGIASWYSAQLTPRPTPQAEGSTISPKPNFAIIKVNRNSFTTLDIETFPDATFSEAKRYTILMRTEGSNLTARLFERVGETNRQIAELHATDKDLTHGYVGVNSFDRLGLLAKGNNPIQFTFDNFKAAGVEQAPTLWVDKTVVYWNSGMSDYQLESAESITGPFAAAGLTITPATDGFINTVTPQKTGHTFFRLRRK